MTRSEYHAECLGQSIADAGFDGAIPQDKIAEIAEAFVAGLDMESEAFGDIYIPNPQTIEIKRLEGQLKKKDEERENVEDAWIDKLCAVRGIRREEWFFSRRGSEIEITERR